MPIKGRSDIVRIPRVGKIHLGVKKRADSGNEYPTAVDHFVVHADDSTSENAVEAFRKVYGDKPKEIKIAFPTDTPDQFFPQWLSSYRKRGGGYELFCRGDGVTASRADGTGGRTDIPCLYKECPLYLEGKCKELGQLQFFLPEVDGIGVWQVDTSSFHSTVNLNSAVELITRLTGGRIAMLPLTLRVVAHVANPDGKPKTVYVLKLDIDNISLSELRQPRPPALVTPSVDPIPEHELPTDLYPESTLVADPPSTVLPKVGAEDDKDEERDVAAIAAVAFRPYGGKDDGIALVKLASVNGELIEVVTSEPLFIERLRQLQEGTAVHFGFAPSERFINRKELTDLAVVV